MKVSVIIPCYNDWELVPEAINSVVCQTHSPHEIIVVDDGSDDPQFSLIFDEDVLEEIKLITHEKNLGLPAARNSGITSATGDLIAFLDADDRWLPEKLDKQVAKMASDPDIGLIYSDYYLINSNKEKKYIRRTRDIPEEDFLEYSFTGRAAGILPSTTLIRKACFESVGLFDENLRLAQELDMWLRIGAEYPTYRIPTPLVDRTVREDSLGSDKLTKIDYRMNVITPKITNMYPEMEKYTTKREAFLEYERASFYASQGEIHKARRSALRAISLNPTLFRAYVRFFTTLLGTNLSQTSFNFLRAIKLEYMNVRHSIHSRLTWVGGTKSSTDDRD